MQLLEPVLTHSTVTPTPCHRFKGAVRRVLEEQGALPSSHPEGRSGSPAAKAERGSTGLRGVRLSLRRMWAVVTEPRLLAVVAKTARELVGRRDPRGGGGDGGKEGEWLVPEAARPYMESAADAEPQGHHGAARLPPSLLRLRRWVSLLPAARPPGSLVGVEALAVPVTEHPVRRDAGSAAVRSVVTRALGGIEATP